MSGLVISITAIGQADSDQIIYRNGARPGDLIVTTGDLGGAYFGLQLLEREKQIFLENPDIQPDLEEQDYLVGRLLKPEARKDKIGRASCRERAEKEGDAEQVTERTRREKHS